MDNALEKRLETTYITHLIPDESPHPEGAFRKIVFVTYDSDANKYYDSLGVIGFSLEELESVIAANNLISITPVKLESSKSVWKGFGGNYFLADNLNPDENNLIPLYIQTEKK